LVGEQDENRRLGPTGGSGRTHEAIDGLIIPGGESTTIGKLMRRYGFIEALQSFAAKKPVFGTCAGLIVLAKAIEGQDDVHLSLMDIKVARNGFGRQRESFEAALQVAHVADDFQAVFIRAPYIIEVGSDVEVLSTFKERIVAVQQGQLLACAFHPELTEDNRMHRYFLDLVEESAKRSGQFVVSESPGRL